MSEKRRWCNNFPASTNTEAPPLPSLKTQLTQKQQLYANPTQAKHNQLRSMGVGGQGGMETWESLVVPTQEYSVDEVHKAPLYVQTSDIQTHTWSEWVSRQSHTHALLERALSVHVGWSCFSIPPPSEIQLTVKFHAHFEHSRPPRADTQRTDQTGTAYGRIACGRTPGPRQRFFISLGAAKVTA